jgi:exopolyphosphatase
LFTVDKNSEGASGTLTTMSAYDTVPSLDDFLQMSKKDTGTSKHYVLGNEAGDADSIISAITLAYVDSVATQEGKVKKTPLVSIPRADLHSQHPETDLLLLLAGVSPTAVDNLIFVDDPLIVNDNDPDQVTLVDHNRLKDVFQEKHWKVAEIIDHHFDEGNHVDTCEGKARQIAFDDTTGTALVASTCTLIVERLQETWEPPYPVSLGILLLGVILLDSINMIPAAGKGTARDGAAIQILLQNTYWEDLSPVAAKTLQASSSSGQPGTQAFFDALQNAKFDPAFWKSLSVRDALRLDYKRFATETTTETTGSFGVATVLLSLRDFCTKPSLVQGLLEYMQEVDVNFLAIMLTFTTDTTDELSRQLVLCSTKQSAVDDMLVFLTKVGSLELEEVTDDLVSGSESELTVRFFHQGNAKASRKQVAPIFLQFFDSIQEGDSKL